MEYINLYLVNTQCFHLFFYHKLPITVTKCSTGGHRSINITPVNDCQEYQEGEGGGEDDIKR